jgi:hypothetical protein
MHKHLANLTIFQPKTDVPVGSWHLALNHWKEARQLRKTESARAEIVSQLTPQILDDIGETDCRRRRPTFRRA